jgi:3-oxoacyl-[acyl-carrier-protein] synthase-1
MTAAYYLNELGLVSALGTTLAETATRLFAGESGVRPTAAFTTNDVPLGVVDAELPTLDDMPRAWRSRNNRLAWLAAQQIAPAARAAIARYGAERVAVIVGTSTSGIGESEAAIRAWHQTGALPDTFDVVQQELGALSAFLAHLLGAKGPAFAHSTACASGAKAMASAARLLHAGLADAVITGGVDSLCGFTVAGFASLNLVSTRQSNPFSINRDGINIGEAAALFLMTREEATVRLMGWGESSDGHHFSAPDPTGRGATLAIQAAFARAQIDAPAVEYVNLHATGTRANDEMEGAVVHALLGNTVPVSGSKPQTGHTLGAAGALEAGLCWLTMQDTNARGALPPHLWDGEADPAIAPLHHVALHETLGRPPRVALSTSFAFGGANAAVLLGRS